MKRIAALLLCCASALFTASCRQTAQGYLGKANQLFAAGKNEEAILNYKKAIQRDAKFGEAYYRLALADLKTGDARDGYGALLQANRLMPDRSDVKVALADLLLLSYTRDKSRPQAQYAELTKLSDELIAKDSHSYDGFRIKAYLAWSDGHNKEAEDFFSKANAAKPMMPDLVVSWVQALFRDQQEQEAEKLARQLIQAHKDAGLIYDVLYGHYRSQNKIADAENVLRTKANNNPANIEFAIQLAAFYAANGKRDQMAAVIKPLLDDPKTFPTAHLRVGDFYSALHEWPEALQQYQQGTKDDPKNKTVYLKRIADSWLAQGKGEEAAGVVGEILKDQPKDDAAKAVNATLLLKTGKPDKIQAGINDLQELVKKQPDNAVLRFTLARALLAKGDQAAARTEFQELLKKRPRHLPSILALGEMSLAKRDFPQAIEYANSALAVNPRLVPARMIHATALAGQNNNTQARIEFNSLATDIPANLPQNTEVQFQLAAVDLAEKKYPQAETRLLALYNKQKLMALAGLVEVYRAEGHLDKAISRLTLELGKEPNTVPIHAMMADTLLRAGKYDEALDQYKQLHTLGARSPQIDVRIGTIYQVKGEFAKALESFKAAQEQAPNDPVVNSVLADAYRLTNRNTEALIAYRHVLALDPENPNIMNNLAYTILDTGGAPDEAQKLAEKALQKSPKNPNYADTLGMVYMKKNLEDSAVQVFSSLTQRFPDNPVFLYHYALSLTQKGEKAKAKTELEVALRKSPPDELRRSIQSSLAKIQQ